MWMTGHHPHNPAGYCPTCDVFGPEGEPCWNCGRDDLESRIPPAYGHHHDPGARSLTVAGEVVSIGRERQKL